MKRGILLLVLIFVISFSDTAPAQVRAPVGAKNADLYIVNGYRTTMPVMIPVSVSVAFFDLSVSKQRQGSFAFTVRNRLNGWVVDDFILGQPGQSAAIAFDFEASKVYYLPQDVTARIMQTMTGRDRLEIKSISTGEAAPTDMQLVLVDASALRPEDLERFPQILPQNASDRKRLAATPTKPAFFSDPQTYARGVIIPNRPLITAAANGQTDMVKTLMASGADINETDPANGYNALMAVAKMGDEAMAFFLMDMGIDVRHINRYGQNALHISSGMGLFDLSQKLLSAGLKPNDRDNGGNTALMYASASPNASLAEMLIRRGAGVNDTNSDNSTPLAFAAYYGNTRSVELLIDKGADVNVADRYSDTVLMRAVRAGNVNITGRLLKSGANVNVRDSNGSSPLLVSVEDNRTGIAVLLMDAGADLNAQNQAGRTPLMAAAENGNVPLVKAMLTGHADLFQVDSRGSSAYSLAKDNPQIAPIIAQSVRDANELAISLFDRVAENDIAGVEKLLKNGVRVNAADEETGNTPIFAAVANNYKNMAALLLKNGADVNWQNKNGNTPLMVAVSTGDERLVETLISAGAGVNIQNSSGDTPLLWAVKLQRFDIVRILIANQADPNIRNFEGVSPLAVANGENMTDIVRMLQSAGAF